MQQMLYSLVVSASYQEHKMVDLRVLSLDYYMHPGGI